MFFLTDGRKPSASAILRCQTIEEALHKAEEMAKFDGREVEIWRDQKLLGRFPETAGKDNPDREEEV